MQTLRRSSLYVLITVALSLSWISQAQGPRADRFPAKVLVGYQGWFRCPGDGSPRNEWSHWSRGIPSQTSMTVDLYPDVSELPSGSLCGLPGMEIQGKQAFVFSSFSRPTVEKHFGWMKQYGIDGALLQRFIGEIGRSRAEGDVVLQNVLTSAADNDRVFAIEYDLSGSNPATVLQQLQEDWQYLIADRHITESPSYLKWEGHPVVSIWGLGLAGAGNHVVDPVIATAILDWFHKTAHAKVIGGTPAGWSSLSDDSVSDPSWDKVYAKLDAVQPWTVGRYSNLAQVDRWKQTHLVPDLAKAKKNKQVYMPVIFPGFSWHNLNHNSPENQIPRLGGLLLWRQAVNAYSAGARVVKIAMFDEVNEGTAIFKAAPLRSQAPEGSYWLTLDADGEQLPNDWYLRLAGEIGKMYRGETQPAEDLPLRQPVRPK